jgi:hypothetical protein
LLQKLFEDSFTKLIAKLAVNDFADNNCSFWSFVSQTAAWMNENHLKNVVEKQKRSFSCNDKIEIAEVFRVSPVEIEHRKHVGKEEVENDKRHRECESRVDEIDCITKFMKQWNLDVCGVIRFRDNKKSFLSIRIIPAKIIKKMSPLPFYVLT